MYGELCHRGTMAITNGFANGITHGGIGGVIGGYGGILRRKYYTAPYTVERHSLFF